MTRQEPVHVPIATLYVDENGLRIESADPAAVRVAAGVPVMTRAFFRFADTSKRAEHLDVTLEGEIAGRTPPAATHHVHDRPVLDDSQLGFIQQELGELPIGDHVLTAKVSARYGAHGEAGKVVEAAVSVPIQVTGG